MSILLDSVVSLIPWPPVAWDVPLTRSWSNAKMYGNSWSDQARRWVKR